MQYKILGITHGQYSGVREYLFDALNKRHEVVDIFDSSLPGGYKLLKAYNFARSYVRTCIMLRHLPDHPNQWRQLANKNVWVWNKKTQLCEREIKKQANNTDIVLQVGSFHGAYNDKPIKPYVIYTDGTMALSAREYPMYRLWPSEKERIDRKKLEMQTYRKADLVLTFSECCRRSVINDYGIDPDKVATVYTGANIKELPEFEKEYTNKTILFVGKDFHRKGGDILVKAFEQVRKKIKDAKLVIVGSVPKIDDKNMLVRGFCSYDELVDLYKNSAVFCMPSHQENLGHVYLEAMAYKMPCVGSFTGGVPEIIRDGETGFLVEPDNAGQLADRLILLLEDENLMRKMGETGRRRVEELFTWESVIEKMTREFENMSIVD
ncbi:MAG: glycosyltransferase family 4 protein [Candidatus Methanoperedens sp.]|nr:glycosyltransferase family 4 protein [Candidatus Methanoperedens nitroreducens]MDJ1420755.1 glycosyltransferase family 4 protein [Candidatus Methanoperedens sp.]